MTRAAVGRYIVVDTLGEGGMGVVYAARDEQLGRLVAIKMVSRAAHVSSARERLLREARAAASVNHPAICQLYEIGRTTRLLRSRCRRSDWGLGIRDLEGLVELVTSRSGESSSNSAQGPCVLSTNAYRPRRRGKGTVAPRR